MKIIVVRSCDEEPRVA